LIPEKPSPRNDASEVETLLPALAKPTAADPLPMTREQGDRIIALLEGLKTILQRALVNSGGR
jgi:hypothetical protein